MIVPGGQVSDTLRYFKIGKMQPSGSIGLRENNYYEKGIGYWIYNAGFTSKANIFLLSVLRDFL